MHDCFPDELREVVSQVAARLQISSEEALEFVVRDWAISQGLIDQDTLREDTPTGGNA
jgi:hypothetical protein